MTYIDGSPGIAPSTTQHQTWLCMLCLFTNLSKEQIANIMSATAGQLFDSTLTWEYFQMLQCYEAAEYTRILRLDKEDLEVHSVLQRLFDHGRLFGYLE